MARRKIGVCGKGYPIACSVCIKYCSLLRCGWVMYTLGTRVQMDRLLCLLRSRMRSMDLLTGVRVSSYLTDCIQIELFADHVVVVSPKFACVCVFVVVFSCRLMVLYASPVIPLHPRFWVSSLRRAFDGWTQCFALFLSVLCCFLLGFFGTARRRALFASIFEL